MGAVAGVARAALLGSRRAARGRAKIVLDAELSEDLRGHTREAPVGAAAVAAAVAVDAVLQAHVAADAAE